MSAVAVDSLELAAGIGSDPEVKMLVPSLISWVAVGLERPISNRVADRVGQMSDPIIGPSRATKTRSQDERTACVAGSGSNVPLRPGITRMRLGSRLARQCPAVSTVRGPISVPVQIERRPIAGRSYSKFPT